MHRRRFLAVAGSGLATAVAGCSSGESTPTPTGRTVFANFRNESGWTLVFTVAAIPDGMGGVTIEYRDGSERTIDDAETLDDIPASAWDGAVSFTPLADVQRRRYRSTDGSGIGIEFPDVPAGTTVVSTIARPGVEDSMLSFGASTCGDSDTTRVEAAVDSDGRVHLHTTCASERGEDQ